MGQFVFASIQKIQVRIKYFSGREILTRFAMSNSNRRGIGNSIRMKTVKLMSKSKKLKGLMDSFVALKPKKWL